LSKFRNLSRAKLSALIGAIFLTLVLFTTFASAMNNLENITPEEKVGIILATFIHFILVWTVFSKIDVVNKKGWIIFTLVYGIFILLNGIVVAIVSPLNGLGRIIAGASLVTAFALKISSENKEKH
jgi:uncharacterized membrane protein